MKIKLKLVIGQAKHFLRWELPRFEREFQLVDEASADTVVFAYGPDVFKRCAELPALKRVALLFPGFGFNPYHNLETRGEYRRIINDGYDAVLVNPGPIHEAFKDSPKVTSHPFSVDIERVLKFKRIRRAVRSLIHISADSPQKDWERSRETMRLTGLRCEVFPPRAAKDKLTVADKLRWRYHKYLLQPLGLRRNNTPNAGYVEHQTVIQKYRQYDGFVHIAAEKPDPVYLDGKYTATLYEAGVTGAILFWHDTLQLGNDFETVFSLSKDPTTAAGEILDIRKNLDVARHSQLTSDEICDRCNPDSVIKFRRKVVESLL